MEKLKGDRTKQYSIRINDRWWVCFRWKGGDAYEVEIGVASLPIRPSGGFFVFRKAFDVRRQSNRIVVR